MKELFTVGPPVSGELFYGRADILKELTISFGNNYALVGLRRSGKTSIMIRLAEFFKRKGLIPVTISANEIVPLTIENFLRKYYLEVTAAYLKDKALIEKLREFIKGRKEGFTDFFKDIRIGVSVKDLATIWFERSGKIEDYTELLKKTISYPETLATESKKKFIIFIDEFQDLESIDHGFLAALREHMQKTKNVEYIISGSAVGLMAQILGDKQSPFYGFFLTKRIGGLEIQDCKELLARGLLVGVSIEDSVIDEVIAKTGGLPLYIQAFGDSAVKVAILQKKKIITRNELMDCWKAFFDELFFHFEYLRNELRGNKLDVVMSIAKGSHSVAQISNFTAIPMNALGSYLCRLVKEGFLVKEGEGRYYLSDPMLEEWLRQEFDKVSR